MKNTALIVAGIVFSLVAIIHFVRLAKGWEIVFNHFTVPMHWSIYGGVVAAILAVWMFIAASR